MNDKVKITVEFATDEKTNGLGMMIGQYLEQNLEEFEDKVKQALKLNISTSVEVEKGISTSITFNKDTILIQNGVIDDTDLHLKSSYATLADVLSGKVNPFIGVMSGEIKIAKLPVTKPFQALKVLSFLKIPEELLIKDQKGKKPVLNSERVLLFLCGMGCGFAVSYLFVLFGWL